MSKKSLASGLRLKKKKKTKQNKTKTKQTNKKTTAATTTKHAVAGQVSTGSKLKALFVTLGINLRRLVS